jgi:hypothetical protein
LVVETLSAVPAQRRRRRRSREADADAGPPAVPLSRVSAVRAGEPFESEEEAELWLRESADVEDTVDVLVEEGIAVLNRALHAQAASSADPRLAELTPERAIAVRIGYGSGEQVAAGRHASAREVDASTGGASRRRRRAEELRPQERLAALLGGKERVDPCETLLLRARADLDGGRSREAALQLRAGLEALLAELPGAVADPGHEDDMAALAQGRSESEQAARAALTGEIGTEREGRVRELLETAERVLRRRRVLGGG